MKKNNNHDDIPLRKKNNKNKVKRDVFLFQLDHEVHRLMKKHREVLWAEVCRREVTRVLKKLGEKL